MNRFWKIALALVGGNPWEYGTCSRFATPARRHVLVGNIQFVLHKKGTNNHFEDYWHNFDTSWYPTWELGPVASYEYGEVMNTMGRRHKQTGKVDYTDYHYNWKPTTPDIAAQFKPFNNDRF
jgi:hypothetical protein